jgi:hypothetical protein
LRKIDVEEVGDFKYSDWAYKELIKDFELPDETYYNERLQIEQQIEGHYHIHYRNLRLEFDNLQEIGFSRYFGAFKIYRYRLQNMLHRLKMEMMSRIYRPKKFSELSKLGVKIERLFS